MAFAVCTELQNAVLSARTEIAVMATRDAQKHLQLADSI
jgi:hypothetical protein